MAASLPFTHPRLHIKSANDAHILFEAVRLGHLPMVKRRLTPTERLQIESGQVFVWEEAPYKGGLERWTDGRKWSASRMREPFLFYEEKPPSTSEDKEMSSSTGFGPPSPTPPHLSSGLSLKRQDHTPLPDGLTKQTYSACVTMRSHSGSVTKKKWHLTAYFSHADFSSLPSVLDDPLLRSFQVPVGMYETGKGLIRRVPQVADSERHARNDLRDDGGDIYGGQRRTRISSHSSTSSSSSQHIARTYFPPLSPASSSSSLAPSPGFTDPWPPSISYFPSNASPSHPTTPPPPPISRFVPSQQPFPLREYTPFPNRTRTPQLPPKYPVLGDDQIGQDTRFVQADHPQHIFQSFSPPEPFGSYPPTTPPRLEANWGHTRYSQPRTSEDRRALSAFRVVL